jgi:Domain of unknown function (DUF4124)
MKRALISLVLMMFAAAAAAQLYKWVDKDGKVRYGDTPPPGVKAAPLKGPSGSAAAPSAATKGEKDKLSPEAAFRKRQEEAAKDREKQAQSEGEAAAKKENCARAQEAVRTLESGQRIARTDSKGERYYMEEAQIATELAKSRQAMQQACS